MMGTIVRVLKGRVWNKKDCEVMDTLKINSSDYVRPLPPLNDNILTTNFQQRLLI